MKTHCDRCGQKSTSLLPRRVKTVLISDGYRVEMYVEPGDFPATQICGLCANELFEEAMEKALMYDGPVRPTADGAGGSG